jgi:hypothetical protein
MHVPYARDRSWCYNSGMTKARSIRSAGRSLVFARYSTAKLAHRAALWSRRNTAPVLVYTAGKVGSTAVADSLWQHGVSSVHLHRLQPAAIRRSEQARRRTLDDLAHVSSEQFPVHLWDGDFYSSRVRRGPPTGDRWKVVTLVRDPIARNVSAFFQNLELVFHYDYREQLRTRSTTQVVDELLDRFDDAYVSGRSAFDLDADLLTWFDEELHPVLGIDVYRSPFPAEKGFARYRSPTADVLLLRLEDLDRCAPEAFADFLSLVGFSISPSNTGEDKSYSQLYREFIARLRLPADHLDALYSARLARHFYTTAELAAFRSRWTGR